MHCTGQVPVVLFLLLIMYSFQITFLHVIISQALVREFYVRIPTDYNPKTLFNDALMSP